MTTELGYVPHAYDPQCPCARCVRMEVTGEPQAPIQPGDKGWYLLVTVNAGLAVKVFQTRADAELWAGRFALENVDNHDDNCIEGLFEGQIHLLSESWKRL